MTDNVTRSKSLASILIGGASSGFGALTAHALAADGHAVHPGMRDLSGHSSTDTSTS